MIEERAPLLLRLRAPFAALAVLVGFIRGYRKSR